MAEWQLLPLERHTLAIYIYITAKKMYGYFNRGRLVLPNHVEANLTVKLLMLHLIVISTITGVNNLYDTKITIEVSKYKQMVLDVG